MAQDHAPIEALVRQLYGLGAVRRDIERHALAGLGTHGFTTLAVAWRHGPLRVSDIAQRLGVGLSVASRQVAALAAQGYVERRADATDRRAQIVACTPAGERAVRAAHRRMVAAFAEVLDAWPEEDVDALAHGLERLREDYMALAGASAPTQKELV